MALEALRSVKRLKGGKRMVAGGSGTLEALKPGGSRRMVVVGGWSWRCWEPGPEKP